jgi:hypothetical protein
MKTLAQIHGLVRTHSTPWAHCVIEGHMLTLIGKAMDENAPRPAIKAQARVCVWDSSFSLSAQQQREAIRLPRYCHDMTQRTRFAG